MNARSAAGLRDVVHQRVRLGVLAILAQRHRATFTELRDALGQSDGGLSRHLSVLEQHGLIALDKVFENRRPRTWVTMTDAGAAAFLDEQEQLAGLLETAALTSSLPSPASAPGAPTDVAAAVVFAALLDADAPTQARGEDRSALVPSDPVVCGEPAQLVATGPIDSQYRFPEAFSEFGEQREQRLMLRSHGLQGGWISTWKVEPDIVVQAVALELGSSAACDAILSMMAPSSIEFADDPGVRAYLLTPPAVNSPATAVAWFAAGRILAFDVVTSDASLVEEALRDIVEHSLETLSAAGR